MESLQKHQNVDVAEEEKDFLRGMGISGGLVHNMVLKAACELDLFDLILNAGGPDAQLSAAEIASLLPIQNPQGTAMLDRMLRFLSSFSFFNCQVMTDEDEDEDGDNPKRLYSLGPASKILIPDKDGSFFFKAIVTYTSDPKDIRTQYLLDCHHSATSLDHVSWTPLLHLTLDKVMIDAWCHLKDAILGRGEGGAAFALAHGMNAFEYPSKDSRFNDVFNKAMLGPTSMVINRLLEVYNGFDGFTELVDVGGGFGATTGAIVSKYPNIPTINFDLPRVISTMHLY